MVIRLPAAVLILLALVLLRGSVEVVYAAAASEADEAVAWLNSVRQSVGVQPVRLDDALSVDAAAHAEYLVRNVGQPSTFGLFAHSEDVSLPFATTGGGIAAPFSNIDYGAASAQDGVKQLLAVPLHRRGLLDPGLRRIGVGLGLERTTKAGEPYHYTAVFYLGAEFEGPSPVTASPVVYPFAGQSGVETSHNGEIPEPGNATPMPGKPLGLVISIEPSCGSLAAPSRAEVRDASGTTIPIWVITPGTVLSATGGTRVVEQVLLVPQSPLEPGSKYEPIVDGTCDQRPYHLDWSFTTAQQPARAPVAPESAPPADDGPMSTPLLQPAIPPHCAPGAQPSYSARLAALAAQVGPAMGEPIDCEWRNPLTGLVAQRTSTGIAFYDRQSNAPVFSTGVKRWSLTDEGLQHWTAGQP